LRRENRSVACPQQQHLRIRHDGGLRVNDFNFEVGGRSSRPKDEYEYKNENRNCNAKYTHNHPPFHAKGVKVGGLRRSPGFASKDAISIRN
jgi:hypothetical protein